MKDSLTRGRSPSSPLSDLFFMIEISNVLLLLLCYLINPAMVRTAENVFNHLLVDSLVDSLHDDSNPNTMAGKNDDSVEDGYDGI